MRLFNSSALLHIFQVIIPQTGPKSIESLITIGIICDLQKSMKNYMIMSLHYFYTEKSFTSMCACC